MPILTSGRERKRARHWMWTALVVLAGLGLLFAVLVFAAATIPLKGDVPLPKIGGKGKVVIGAGDIGPARGDIPQGIHGSSPLRLPVKLWTLRIGKRVYYVIL